MQDPNAILKSFDKSNQIYSVKVGDNIGYSDSECSNGVYITDIEHLPIEVSDSGFSDVRVTRLSDLHLDYVDFVYKKDQQDRFGVPGQYLGTTLDLTGVKLVIHFTSSSGVSLEKVIDEVQPSDCVLYTKTAGQYTRQSDLKIYSNTKKLSFTYKYNEGTEAGQAESFTREYDIFSTRKLLRISLNSWTNDTQFTDTKIDTSTLSLKLLFSDSVSEEVYQFNGSNNYLTFKLNKSKWQATNTTQNVKVTCNYLNDDEYDFDVQTASVTVEKANIQMKRVKQILSYSVQVTGPHYYLETPSAVCNSLKIKYNNGDEREVSSEELDNVSFYVPFSDGLHSASSELIEYYIGEHGEFIESDTPLTKGYTKEWHSVEGQFSIESLRLSYHEKDASDVDCYCSIDLPSSYTVYSKILSIVVENPLPNQYEENQINFNGFKYNVLYNNGQSLSYNTVTLSNITFNEDDVWDSVNNRWTYPANGNHMDVSLTIVHTDIYGQSSTFDTSCTLYQKSVESISVSSNSYVFEAGSPVDLSQISIMLNYNNGSTEFGNPTSVNLDGQTSSYDTYATFTESDPSTVLRKSVNHTLYYNNVSLSGVGITLTRNYKSDCPMKAFTDNDNPFVFGDEPHYQNREVHLDTLKKIVIYYTDNSTKTIVFEDGENRYSKLSENLIRLHMSTWGLQLEQYNWFVFNNSISTESQLVIFSIKIEQMSVSLKEGHYLYQGGDVATSLASDFNFVLDILNEEGGTRKILVFNYSDLPKYNAKVTVSGITTWPLEPEEGTSVNYTTTVVMSCKPDVEGSSDFDISVSVPLSFRRVISKVLLRKSELDEPSESLTWGDNEKRIVGSNITLADLGFSQSLEFINGGVIENVGIDLLPKFKRFVLNENDEVENIERWPLDGQFFVCFNEFSLPIKEPKATIKCTNMISKPSSIVVTQKENSHIEAGTTVKKEDLNITVKGLLGETIEHDLDNVQLTNADTKSTDTVKLVTVTYTDPNFENARVYTNVNVTLASKVCTISYSVYKDGGILTNVTIAGDSTYSPSVNSQKKFLEFRTKDMIGNKSIYTFDHLDVNVTGVSYSDSNSTLTIDGGVDSDLIIKIFVTSAFVKDNYNHAYSIDSSGNLQGVYSLTNPQGTYEIPDSVKTITSSQKAFVNLSTLRSLIIGTNVERIKDSAFSNCSYLSEIKFKGPRNKKISIGRAAFKGCSKLATLDFLDCGDIRQHFICGTPDDNPINGSVVFNTWEGCILRTIRINKSSFTSVLRHHHINNDQADAHTIWATSRCGGGWRIRFTPISVDPRETWVRCITGPSLARPGTEGSNGYASVGQLATYIKGISTAMIAVALQMSGWSAMAKLLEQRPDLLDSDIIKTYKTYESSSSHETMKNNQVTTEAGGYAFYNKDALAVRSDNNSFLSVTCYGLGWSEYNYDYVKNLAKYKFTTNGRVGSEFISVEFSQAGHHFSNWDNTEYVNNCIYPNVKLSDTTISESEIDSISNPIGANYSTRNKYNSTLCGTRLDFMIPLY